MIICLAVDTLQGNDYLNVYKFPREENLKQQWLIK